MNKIFAFLSLLLILTIGSCAHRNVESNNCKEIFRDILFGMEYVEFSCKTEPALLDCLGGPVKVSEADYRCILRRDKL